MVSLHRDNGYLREHYIGGIPKKPLRGRGESILWTWDDVREEMRFAKDSDCPACPAKKGDMCLKKNGSIRRTPHGPRRNRSDRDWPGEQGSPMSYKGGLR